MPGTVNRNLLVAETEMANRYCIFYDRVCSFEYSINWVDFIPAFQDYIEGFNCEALQLGNNQPRLLSWGPFLESTGKFSGS